MPITLKRGVAKIGGSLRLTVPPEIAELLQIKQGDQVEFDMKNDEVVIRKAKGNHEGKSR